MIEWWGPMILEYYAATEGIGFTPCDSHEWLAHKGTVGQGHARRAAHPRRRHPAEVPNGTPGTIWFKTATAVRVLQRPGEDEGGDDRRTAR